MNYRAGQAATLNNIGQRYAATGQPEQALAYLQPALPLQEAVGDRAGKRFQIWQEITVPVSAA